MKIGFDAKRAFHNNRGLGNYSRSLIEGLAKFYPEYQYFLYTPPYPDSQTLNWEMPPKVSIHKPSGFFHFFPGIWRSFCLWKNIVSDGLDIYHGLSHELPWQIEKSGVRSIVTIHDLIAFRFPHLFPWLDRCVYIKKITHSCHKADVIVAICEQTKRDIQEYIDIPAQKIKVLYQSVHPRFYELPEKTLTNKILSRWKISFPYILFVGALEERKNVINLVKAYSTIRQSKDYGLILIGKGGDYQKKVETLVRKLRLEKKVKILSQIGTEVLPSFYAGCNLFCYPSLFEGFGLPVAEALFCRKPVIASQGSCFSEVGGEGVIFTDPRNVNNLADAMETILDNQERQTKMVKIGRAHVEKFHWQKTTEELMQVYRDISGR